jgi:hypothetical protein
MHHATPGRFPPVSVRSPRLAIPGSRAHGAAMARRSPLDDPRIAQFAWARYRRLMRWMMLVTVTTVIGAVVALYKSNGAVSIHLYIAAALGIGFAMLLMSALMGLVFLSNGTGHDDAIAPAEDIDPWVNPEGDRRDS